MRKMFSAISAFQMDRGCAMICTNKFLKEGYSLKNEITDLPSDIGR